MPSTCSVNTVICFTIVILIVAFTDNIINSIPVVKNLFTDSINYILLLTLVVLVMCVNIPCGIMLAFLVLYLSIYINNMSKTKSQNINKQQLQQLQQSQPQSQLESQYQLQYQPQSQPQPKLSRQYLSESEILYNNNNMPYPNHNLKPFEPQTQDVINNKTEELLNNKFNNPTMNDFITNVDSPSRDGYDVSGCRYDFRNSPQNLTLYGPPLAQCATYSGDQAKTCGTVFYPLNM